MNAFDMKAYIKNLAKSVSYVATESIKDTNPILAEFATTNKDAFKEMYQLIKDSKKNVRRGKDAIANNEYTKVITGTVSNFFSDLKSGKFYNPERQAQADDQFAKDMGFDFDDSFGGFDDVDENFGDDSKTLDSEKADAIGERIANANGRATMTAADYVVRANKASNSVLMAHNEMLFGKVFTGMSSITGAIASSSKATADILNTQSENSKKFYEYMTKQTAEQTGYLKQIYEMLNNRFNPKKVTKKQKLTLEDVMGSNGVVDLKGLKDLVVQNAKNQGGLVMSMGSMLTPGTLQSMLSSPVASLMKLGTSAGIKKAIGQTNLDNLNKSFGSMFSNAALRLAQNATYATGKGKIPFGGLVADLLGIRRGAVNTKVRTGKYNKGRADWTGKDAKALREVIPTQLAEIISILSGKEAKIFDYETGKWKTNSVIAKDHNERLMSISNFASYDIRNELENFFEKDEEVKSKGIKRGSVAFKSFQDDLSAFYNFLSINNMKIPTDNAGWVRLERYMTQQHMFVTKGTPTGQFSMARSSFSKIKAGYKYMAQNGKTSTIMQSNASLIAAGNDIDRYIKNQATDPSALTHHLFNNSGLNGNLNGKPIKNNILTQYVDDRGNNIFFYLQSFYTDLKRIANNQNGKPSKNKKKKNNSTGNHIIDSIIVPDNSNHDEDNNKDKDDREILDLSEVTASDANPSPNGGGSNNGNKPNDPKKDELRDYINQKIMSNPIIAKLGLVGKGIANLLAVPITSSREIVTKADQMMYRMIFGKDGESHENESILSRFTKGVKGFFKDLGKNVTRFFTSTLTPIPRMMGDIVAQTLGFSDFKKMLDEGIGKSPFIMGIKNGFKGAFGWIKDSVKSVFGEVDNAFFGGGIGKTINKTKNKLKNNNNDQNNGGGNNDDYAGNHARGITRIKRSGMASVSKGEMIIPAELVPGHTGSVDKSAMSVTERINARNYYTKKKHNSNNYFGDFASGSTDGNDGSGMSDNMKRHINRLKQGVHYAGRSGSGIIQNSLFTHHNGQGNNGGNPPDPTNGEAAKKILDAAKESGEMLKNGTISVMTRLFGRTVDKYGNPLTPEESRKLMEEQMSAIKKEVKKHAPTLVVGGVLGGAASALTGMVGGPLVGIAVGSMIGLATKSENFQKILFGEKTAAGDMTGGLFNAKISTFLKNKFPTMAKYGVTGGIGGLIGVIPGGPLAGIAVGSVLSFATHSDQFRNALFGDMGILGKDTDKAIKKALPKIGLGALIGAGAGLVGPFGIVGGSLIGGTLGFLTESEKFKKAIFGVEDSNGIRQGGLLGIVRDQLIDPAKDYLKGSIKKVNDYFMKNLFNPITKLAKSLSDTLIHGVAKFGDMVKGVVKETVGIPFMKVLNTLVKPFTKSFRWAADKIVGGVGLLGKGFGFVTNGLGDKLNKRAVAKGYSSMSAKERVAFARNTKGLSNGYAYQDYDNAVSELGFNDLSEARDAIMAYKSSADGSKINKRKMRENIRDRVLADQRWRSSLVGDKKLINVLNRSDNIVDVERYLARMYDQGKFGNDQEKYNSLLSYVRDQYSQYSSSLDGDIGDKKNKAKSALERLGIGGKDIESVIKDNNLLRLIDADTFRSRKFLDAVNNGENGEDKGPDTPTIITDINGNVKNIYDLLVEAFGNLGVLPNAFKLTGADKNNSNNNNQNGKDNSNNNNQNKNGNNNGNPPSPNLLGLNGLDTSPVSNNGIISSNFRNGLNNGGYNFVNNELLTQIRSMSAIIATVNGFDEEDINDSGSGNNNGGIINKGKGIISKIKKKFAEIKNKKENEDKVQTDADGNIIKYTRSSNGDLVPDTRDSQTRETLKRNEDDKKSRLGILSSLSGVGGVFNSIKNFFTGGEDKDKNKKPGLIDTILGFGKGILGTVSGAFNGLTSILGPAGTLLKAGAAVVAGGNIYNWASENIPGFADVVKKTLGGVVDGIKTFFADHGQQIVDAGVGALKAIFKAILSVMPRSLDDLFHMYRKFGKKSDPNATVNGKKGRSGSGYTGVPSKKKKDKEYYKDDEYVGVNSQSSEYDSDGALKIGSDQVSSAISGGDPESEEGYDVSNTKLGAASVSNAIYGNDGTKQSGGKIVGYINKDGVFTRDGSPEYHSKTATQRVKGALVRAAVGGRTLPAATKLVPIAGKPLYYGVKGVSKVSTKATELVGKSTLVQKGVTKLGEAASKSNFIQKIVAKVQQILAFIFKKFGKSAAANAGEESLEAAAKEIGENAAEKGGAKLLGAGLKKAFFIADLSLAAEQAFEDASSILGITRKPTMQERVISAIIGAINNLVTLGILPTEWLATLIINIFNALNIFDLSQLLADREAARAKVDEYNENSGTNYNVREYNKNVQGWYTTQEKVVRFVTGKGKKHDDPVSYSDSESGWQLPDKKSSIGSKSVSDAVSGTGRSFAEEEGDPSTVDPFAKKSKKKSNDGKFVIFNEEGEPTVIDPSAKKNKKKSNDGNIVIFNEEGEPTVIDPSAKKSSIGSKSVSAAIHGGTGKKFDDNGSFNPLLNTSYNSGVSVSYSGTGRKFDDIQSPISNTGATASINNAISGDYEDLNTRANTSQDIMATASMSHDLPTLWESTSSTGDSEDSSTKLVGDSMDMTYKMAYTPSTLYGQVGDQLDSTLKDMNKGLIDTSKMYNDLIKFTNPQLNITQFDNTVANYAKQSSSNPIMSSLNKFMANTIGTVLKSAIMIIRGIAGASSLVQPAGSNVITTSGMTFDQANTTVQQNVQDLSNAPSDLSFNPTDNLNKLDKNIKAKDKDQTSKDNQIIPGVNGLTTSAAAKEAAKKNTSPTPTSPLASTGTGSHIMQMGNSPFGRSTLASNGCGPASAASVLRRYGINSDLNQTASYAKYNKYVAGNSGVLQAKDSGGNVVGTRATYFGDLFAKNGIHSSYSQNKNDIKSAIKFGNPTVLLGQDKKNTSKYNSPFGPNPHYVVAQGMDRRGNVIVDDPELDSTTTYNKNILNKANLGIITGSGAGIYGRFTGSAFKNQSSIEANSKSALAALDNMSNANKKPFEKTAVSNTIKSATSSNASNKSSSGSTSSTTTSGTTSTTGTTTASTSSLPTGDPSGGIGGALGPVGDKNHKLNVDYVGRDSCHWETSDKGPWMVSSGSGDLGGSSYGSYQLVTNKSITDSLWRFWKGYGYQAKTGVEPGANANFKAAWLKEVNENPEQFILNEHDFAMKEYYEPARKYFAKKGIKDPDSRSRAVQELVFAWSNGLGPETFVSRFSKNVGNVDDATTVNKWFSYLYNNAGSIYRSSPAMQKGIMRRAQEEGSLLSKFTSANPISSKGVFAVQGGSSLGIANGGGAIGADGTVGGAGGVVQQQQPEAGVGGFLSEMMSAVGGALSKHVIGGDNGLFGGLFGNSSGSTGTMSTTGTTTDGTGATTTTGADGITVSTSPGNSTQENQMISIMNSIMGKHHYSRPDRASYSHGGNMADCSSTVDVIVNKVTGKLKGLPNTAGILTSSEGVTVDKGNGSGPNESALRPGDLLLYRRKNRNENPMNVGHVEMYMGNGQRAGHGAGVGPKLSSISADAPNYIMARRFTGAGSGLVNNITGSGSKIPTFNFDSYTSPTYKTGSSKKQIKSGVLPMVKNTISDYKKYTGKGSGLDDNSAKLVSDILKYLETIANNTSANANIITIVDILKSMASIMGSQINGDSSKTGTKSNTVDKDKANVQNQLNDVLSKLQTLAKTA